MLSAMALMWLRRALPWPIFDTQAGCPSGTRICMLQTPAIQCSTQFFCKCGIRSAMSQLKCRQGLPCTLTLAKCALLFSSLAPTLRDGISLATLTWKAARTSRRKVEKPDTCAATFSRQQEPACVCVPCQACSIDLGRHCLKSSASLCQEHC